MRVRTVLVFLLAFTFVMSAFAQQQGTITGVVSDPQGAVIPGAKVTARNNATNVVYEASTNASGSFIIPGLPYGVYTVEVAVQGFRTWQGLDVRVITAQVSTVRATMEVGIVTEVVTVEAGGEVLQTTSAEINTNVSRKQILDLPLVTRNPMALATIQAGVTSASTSSSRNQFVNGLRGATNNITVDGINAQDNFLRSGGFFAISTPSVESTAEFSITTNNITSAEGSGVAQIRITTPRGTNDVHGSLFYFHRNDALNANDWFNNRDGTEIEREREHRFGGRVGGPIWRDNSFFFFRYEGFRENASRTRTRTVLTQSARQGLFSYVASCSTNPCGTHPSTGATINSGDPVTLDLIALSSSGFPLNPFAAQFIDATPLPNTVGVLGDDLNTGGVRFNNVGTSERDAFSIRVDHKLLENFGGTHWVEFVWNRIEFLSDPDFLNSDDPNFPEGVSPTCFGWVCKSGAQTSDRDHVVVALSSTFNPTIFNELRAGFQRAPVRFDVGSPVDDFPRSFAVNFPSTISEPERRDFGGGRVSPVYTVLNNFTKIWGNHSFKAGGNFTSRSVVERQETSLRPVVDINASSTNPNGLGTSLFPGSTSSIRSRARNIYEALVGLVDEVDQRFNATIEDGFIPLISEEAFLRERSLALYFQDSWKFRPNLTLNYGLRYEYYDPVDIVNRRGLQPVGGQAGMFISPNSGIFTIDPSITFADILAGTADTLLVPAGDSNGNPLWNKDLNNFAPFVGIAWSIGPKTVLRTGMSVSYSPDGLTVVDNAVSANQGLRSSLTDFSADSNFGPTLDPSQPYAIPAPTFTLPVSNTQNYINSNAGATVFTFDRNLRSPYVLQWSFGIQRELSPSTVFEVRYVGNHAVKLFRGVDFNQINLFGNGLLSEFFLAQQNLACNRLVENRDSFQNRGNPCNVAMPVLEGMNWPFYTTSFRVAALDDNEAGQFWHAIQQTGTVRYLTGRSGIDLSAFPANFFRTNPIINNADAVGNHSRSSYHGLQLEMRRRYSNGLSLQGNYTFSKVLTDFSGSSSEFRAFLDFRQQGYDKGRADFDITHTFHFNGIYELPLGRGRRWADKGAIGKFLEGWQIGSIMTWRSGAPFEITSGRGTLNRAGRSDERNGPALLGGATADSICSQVGAFRSGRTNAFAFPEAFIAANGEANPAIFGHPAAGTLGDQKLGRSGCDNPRFANVNVNVIKRIFVPAISENFNVEVRFEFFNIFNTPNFALDTGGSDNASDIDFSRFGVFESLGSPREVQFNLRVNF